MRLCIVYLASPRDFTIQDKGVARSRLDVLRRSIELTRRGFPTTDLFVFHEDYTDEDKASLPGVTEFLPVDFTTPDVPYAPTNTSRKGYLMMCRFFCGVLQSHPRLQSYTHYMRLDDDSFFLAPYLTEETVRPLLGHDYVYRAAFVEFRDQHSLFEFTIRFLLRSGVSPIQLTVLKSRLRGKRMLVGEHYTGYAPYNNFHVSSLAMWRHPRVRAYLNAIEASGGIFRYGWLDANIHAMILFVLECVQSHHVAYFGYRHNYHVSKLGSLYPVVDESLPFYPVYDGDTPEEACPAVSAPLPLSPP